MHLKTAGLERSTFVASRSTTDSIRLISPSIVGRGRLAADWGMRQCLGQARAAYVNCRMFRK